MSKLSDKSTAFLQALAPQTEEKPIAEPTAPPTRADSRKGLKHIGGYFDRADVEKFAVLRARLALDNSELIRLAVDELYRKHEAKRAFGDAQ
jgi:hypothetical protein